MTAKFTDTIASVLARTPEWIRHDLVAKDNASRTRAEEALAAMIATALADHGEGPAAMPPGNNLNQPGSR
ncbi:hypothetical protein ACLB0R_10700 [Sphingomonas sp. GlSt437]|uniref:hypothetical protein n=1 Tax=Sphingomonas sp. GlSt437 TaxID=3389970 RepID=UPI003A8704E0